MLRVTSIFRKSSWTFQNANVYLNFEAAISASRCFIVCVTRVIGPLWDNVNYIWPEFQTISLPYLGAPSGALQQLTTVSPFDRMSLRMTSDYVQPRRPTIRNHLYVSRVTGSSVGRVDISQGFNVLWRIDPLLSSDSVNNDRFWATSR
jgi:hypothetical protein